MISPNLDSAELVGWLGKIQPEEVDVNRLHYAELMEDSYEDKGKLQLSSEKHDRNCR